MSRQKTTTLRRLMRMTRDRILDNPSQYDQGEYCGTVCCIAGHMDILMFGRKAHSASRNNAFEIVRRVCDAMGIDRRSEPDLFNGDFFGTPFNFAIVDAWRAPHGRRIASAKVGAAAIDWFLRENPNDLNLSKRVPLYWENSK